MKKKLIAIGLTALLTASMVMPAMANTYNGASGWSVTFSPQKKMVQNFSTANMDDVLTGLQPGDDANFEVALSNTYPGTTDWYMKNDIIQSLEDKSYSSETGGGAYAYKLVYYNPEGKARVLYDSDAVGGDTISAAGEGLNEATDALDEWFYLDTLDQNEAGKVTLYVGLDGETQNNDYQDTLAELELQFAVELAGGGTGNRHMVKTGDENHMGIYMAMIAAAGVVILVANNRRAKQAKEGE